MRKRVGTLLGLLPALFVIGCQAVPEADQVAQRSMIGLSKRDVLVCLGRPAWRAPVGQGTEIWTYSGAQARGYGPQWAIGLNTNLPPFAWPGLCDVRLVMTNSRVSQVSYGAAGGGPPPLGEECLFPVERCVGSL